MGGGGGGYQVKDTARVKQGTTEPKYAYFCCLLTDLNDAEGYKALKRLI